MKKLLSLILLIACCLLLVSCTSLTIPGVNFPEINIFGFTIKGGCTTHLDNNGDLKCDKCGEAVECTAHKDNDEDLKCDKCGAEVKCTHKDLDNDGKCDVKACDYAFCTHEYEEDYSYNKTHHFFRNTCDCDIDPKDEEPHTDVNNDGVCDVCSWNYNHTHTYQKTYTYDLTHHWYASTCGHSVQKNYSEHSDRNNDGLCDECEWDYNHVHTYEEEWSIDDTKHWYEPTCGHAIDPKSEGPHTDVNNDGVCDVCEWDYNHVHRYAEGDAWTSDENGHWHAPICGHNIPPIDYEAHVNEPDALGNDDGECDVCRYNMCGPNHRFDPDVWEWDETGHWHPSICGHVTEASTMERKGHDDGTVKDGICEECGYDKMCEHPHETDIYSSNEKYHWEKLKCECTVVPADRLYEHVDTNDNNGVCDICEYQFCKHEFDNDAWAWEEGGTTHWHPTICDHDIPNNKKDEAPHIDNDGNDGVCDICGYQICKHPQSTNEYSSDENYHWNKFAECEHVVPDTLKTLHEDCDSDSDGICDVCLYQFCSHPQDPEVLDKDATHHWNKFTECDHEVPANRKTPHSDDDNDGVCEVCGVYCEHPIVSDDVYESNETHHWNKLTCSHVVPEDRMIAHADGDDDGFCDACNYNVCGENHVPNTNVWEMNASGHWHPSKCGHSNACSEIIPHTDNPGADGRPDGLCDTCGYQVCEHTFESAFTIDQNKHWHETTCGCSVPESTKQDHLDEDDDGWCEICLLQFCTHPAIPGAYDSNMTHHWVKTECGHKLPVSARELHDDPDNDGYCTVCGQYCEHPFDENTYDSDATHHWHTITGECEHVIPEERKGLHVDTNNDNRCDVCERIYISDGDIEVDPDDSIDTPPLIITPKQEGQE